MMLNQDSHCEKPQRAIQAFTCCPWMASLRSQRPFNVIGFYSNKLRRYSGRPIERSAAPRDLASGRAQFTPENWRL